MEWTNLRKKNIPYAERKREGKRIRKYGDKPLARIHAWVYQFSIEMGPKFWQLFLHKPLKLEEVLLNKRKPNLEKS